MPSLNFNTDDLDRLTKLPNTSFFHNIADNLLEAAEENRTSLVVIYFDIDNFKGYNQQYGFEQGDEVLKGVADNIRKFYPKDIFARFSDDHFVVLCQNQWIEAKIAHMHAAVHSCAKYGNPELKAGVYEIQIDDTSISSACDKAKLACNSIKKKYDVDFCIYDEKLADSEKRRQYIADNIDKAIENKDIKLFYQPVMRVISGKMCSLEVLTRWFDVDYDCFTPMDFIPVLEEFRLIHKLDCYVIYEACRAVGNLTRLNMKPVPVSVNLSSLDFELCDVVEELEACVKEHQIEKDMIHIEINESALNDDSLDLTEHIRKLKEHGFQVWMDDFGSKHSSLNNLMNYDFDVIKIDMKFMRDFDKNPKSKIILTSIVDMAKKLDIQTLTEGVETEEQMEFLKNIGCDKAQGYLFSKPVSIAEMTKLKFEKEKHSEITYYNEIGKVNLLSQKPLERIEQCHSDDISYSTLPLAIIEKKKGSSKFLHTNDDFIKVIHSLQVNNTGDIEGLLNSNSKEIHSDFRTLVEKSIKSHKNEFLDFNHNGDHCTVQCKLISENKEDEAFTFLIILQNHSKFTEYSKQD